jgi:hypothetical protein
MDLFVPPKERGRGLQRVTDDFARSLPGLHLGFPNHLAAKIHHGHGWGVRDDLAVMMLPLRPLHLPQLKNLHGVRSLLAGAAAAALLPAVALARRAVASPADREARLSRQPESARLVCACPGDSVTTSRTAEWFTWRFLDSPHREQYSYYETGPLQSPSIVAVTRTFMRSSATVVRILDLFGDLHDRQGVKAVLRAIVADAAHRGAVAVTALAGNSYIRSSLRRAGFLLQRATRLRWWTADSALMQNLADVECHFSLADSDNDSLE